MRSPLSVAALLAGTVALSSCDNPFAFTGCAGVGYWAVTITVQDQAGASQALGATVTLYDGAYTEIDSASDNPLTVYAAEERGGRTYDIKVSKPYYQDTWVRGVRAPGGGCVTGHERSPTSVTVPVRLSLVPNAPAVRSIHLVPRHILLDRPPYTSTAAFTPYVDATVGVSQAVSWRIRGDTASVLFDPVTGRLYYRCLATSGSLTMTATAVADPTVSDTVNVAVQGHPAMTSDPPCS